MLQSGEVTAAETSFHTGETASATQQEVVEFLDENIGYETGINTKFDSVTLADRISTDSSLTEFLSRPVKIATFTWLESDAVGTSHTYNPWNLFFNDTRIKYKLNNYSFINCNLKIKVMINASPFYYGALYMGYQPLTNLVASTITNDSGTRYFIPYSQRPHLWIYPQSSSGGEMNLPFFFQKNFLRVQVAQDFTDMGTLTFLNYTSLYSANGATGAGVTVQVYAWAENVTISGPSLGLALQAGKRRVEKDEYDSKPSTIATAVASAAGHLTSIPFIGPFMTVTQIAGRAISAGLSAIGLTNVPVINDIPALRPVAMPDLSTSDIGYQLNKLTLDPKNELTIDATTLGLTSQDEMDISYLVMKESYLTTLNWSTTNTTDDILFYSKVQPGLFDNDGATEQKAYMTPMSWVSNMFANWRGDIIFRFRFIASQYHKGRVRVIFDPAGYTGENLVSDAVSTTVAFNKIIDLGKDTDVEFRIPYQQAVSWLYTTLPTAANIAWSTSATPTFSLSDAAANGAIVMRVLTTLTAPVTTSNIKILVFVRGAENLEFANPGSQFEAASTGRWSYWAPQSGQIELEEDDKQQVVAGENHIVNPERYLINFGERIMTLRQLLRRSSLSHVRYLTADTTSVYVQWKQVMSRFPLSYGYDPNGLGAATGLVSGAQKSFNWVNFHPITYFMTAFVAVKGSTIWHMNVSFSTNPICHIRMYRNNSISVTLCSINQNGSAVFASANTAGRYAVTTFFAGTGGSAVTNGNTQTGLSVLTPNYTQYRFQGTYLGATTLPSTGDGSDVDTSSFEVVLSGTSGPVVRNTTIYQYCSIGTDFNLHFFLNVPTMWYYSAVPAAV
jgi:hypothetical protein